MDRYRTSIQSHSPVNRSHMTEGHVKSNLESRIEYENSQVSLISLLKVLAIITTLVLLLMATKFVLDERTRGDNCGKKSSFRQYLSRLRFRLFGGVNPDSCERRVEKAEDEVEGGKIEVVTKTTTCRKEDASDGESAGLWGYLTSPFFSCEDYRAHERALKNQKPSVREGLAAPPKVTEVHRAEVSVTKPADLADIGATTEANVREIKSQFDALLASFPPTAASASATPAESSADARPIQKSKKLLEKPTVFDLQLKVNDLVHSFQNLQKKKTALSKFHDTFFNSTTFSPANCAKNITEITQQIELQKEKLAYSANIRETWQKDLHRLEETIKTKLADNKASGPLGQLHSLSLEIEALQKRRAGADKTLGELRRREELRGGYERDVDETNRAVALAGAGLSDLDAQLAKLRLEHEDILRQQKINDSKQSLYKFKLEMASRNKHIKEFLMKLIDTREGRAKDIEAMFRDKIASEKDVQTMIKAFINQSREARSEPRITDAEIDEIIQQDEKDVRDITKLYNELVKIINEYKDIDFDIELTSRNIANLETARKELERKLREVNARILELEGGRRTRVAALDADRAKIMDLRDKIAKISDYLAANRVDLEPIDRELETRRAELASLREQLKVN